MSALKKQEAWTIRLPWSDILAPTDGSSDRKIFFQNPYRIRLEVLCAKL
jgi:hypothetical protein